MRDFTGISAPYEIPEHPDLIIQSSKYDAAHGAKQVISLVEQRQIISVARYYGRGESDPLPTVRECTGTTGEK
ncbi:MAG: hypothetical protein JSU72_10135 [Deltaproteobacteria bacterium]|nr:MAG: hypothetical protein JSU72_10135 [Deltaproteobacteria bacterium]